MRRLDVISVDYLIRREEGGAYLKVEPAMVMTREEFISKVDSHFLDGLCDGVQLVITCEHMKEIDYLAKRYQE